MHRSFANRDKWVDFGVPYFRLISVILGGLEEVIARGVVATVISRLIRIECCACL